MNSLAQLVKGGGGGGAPAARVKRPAPAAAAASSSSAAAAAPAARARGGGSSDEYDSEPAAVPDAEDDAFIDREGDDAELVRECVRCAVRARRR